MLVLCGVDLLIVSGVSNREKQLKQSLGFYGNNGVIIIVCCWGLKVGGNLVCGGEINIENGMFRFVVIFYSVVIVGLDLLCFICFNMVFEMLEIFVRCDKFQFC